jgi:hypothetical protein
MERGHPVRMSAKREQPLNRGRCAERAAHAGGPGCPHSIAAPGTDLIAHSLDAYSSGRYRQP